MIGTTLGELATRFGTELRGDPSTPINGVCTLVPGKPGHLAFLSNPRYRGELASTAASAVIVSARDADQLPGAGLVATDPYVAFARIAALFDPGREFAPGIHPAAVVATDALIGHGVHIGPHAVIGSGTVIGEGSYVGPGCTIGRDVWIGDGARLVAQVHVGDRVRLGRRCHAQPGAVIGSRGFGNARTPQGWVEVPQLGTVIVGDDVEIGAGTCIDRGALDDTVIGNGVRLDNLIQVAHNCVIGEHTAIAACTGMAGSTRIGARCMIGGAVGIAGHLEVGDDVAILGMTMVTKSLPAGTVYGSGMPATDAREWRKQTARYRRLDSTEARIKQLERRLGIEPAAANEEKNDGDD